MDPITTPTASPTTIIAPAPADSAPVAIPTPTPSAPLAPSSAAPPEGTPAANEARRIADAQRAMHAATGEAASLRKEVQSRDSEITELKDRLGRIYADPLMAPFAPPAPGTPATDDEAEYKAAYQHYKDAPDDEQAITRLMRATEERTLKRVSTALEERERTQHAHTQQQKRKAAIHRAVSDTVASTAPDVPLRLFWACAGQAQAETPVDFTDPRERVLWQTERAIALARAELAPRLTQATAAATEAASIRAQAGPVMPGGAHGRPTPSTAPAGTQSMTMADQMRAHQRGLLERTQ